MGKQLIELISEFISFSGNPIIDYIIFFFIGAISFSIAFGFVGMLFDAIGKYDSNIMSDVHWFARVLVFAGLTYLGVKIAQAIKWLFSFQWWVYIILLTAWVGITLLVHYIKHRISLKKVLQPTLIEESNVEPIEQSDDKGEQKATVAGSRYFCPRCYSKLVKRHGPYGDFYGCESFGKTGCRYTRKFL